MTTVHFIYEIIVCQKNEPICYSQMLAFSQLQEEAVC